jgi:hypothetical protein
MGGKACAFAKHEWGGLGSWEGAGARGARCTMLAGDEAVQTVADEVVASPVEAGS